MVLEQQHHLKRSIQRWHQSCLSMKKLARPTRNEAVQELWLCRLTMIHEIKDHASSSLAVLLLRVLPHPSGSGSKLCPHGSIMEIFPCPDLFPLWITSPVVRAHGFCKAKLRTSSLDYLVFPFPNPSQKARVRQKENFWTHIVVDSMYCESAPRISSADQLTRLLIIFLLPSWLQEICFTSHWLDFHF